MIARHDNLDQVLAQIVSRTLVGAKTVVLSRPWWSGYLATLRRGARGR